MQNGWLRRIAPDEGMDANDYEKQYGYFRLGAQLKALVMSADCICKIPHIAQSSPHR